MLHQLQQKKAVSSYLQVFSMIKQILFSLLLTSTAIHSMELILNKDTLDIITHHICIKQNNIEARKNDIRAFATTNIFIYHYYASENTGKNIIRELALYNNVSDSNVTQIFGYKTISNKINCLFNKIDNTDEKLTLEDLKDKWYLNSTITTAYKDNIQDNTLLLKAIKKFDYTKATTLIIANIDCNSTRCKKNPLALIAEWLSQEKLQQEDCAAFIALLLENKIHPDSRSSELYATLLQLAVCFDNKSMARLALQYGANPYLPWHSYANAFALEKSEPKGWLTTMVNEIEQNKKTVNS